MPPFQDVAEQAMLATQHSPIRARPMAERGWSQNRGRIMSHRSPALYGEVAEEPAMGMFDQQTKRDYRRSRSLNAPDTVRAGHLRSPSLGNGGGRLTGIWIPTLPGDDSEEEDIEQSSSPIPTEEPGWSAEEIATRRFMTATTTGGGMTVLKHNRGRGRVKRVLKYNTEVCVIQRVPLEWRAKNAFIGIYRPR